MLTTGCHMTTGTAKSGRSACRDARDRSHANDEAPALGGGSVVVAPTGVDPVTSRFSVVRSTN